MSRSRPQTAAALTAVAPATALTCCAPAGCGAGAAGSARPGPPLPGISAGLPTASAGSRASWAILQLAGARSQSATFWQLLIRPAVGTTRWRLVTPPGVADNGGLVAASAGNGPLTAGFLPSQLLTFTPLASTSDQGAHWAPGLLPAPLAAQPGALAALPGGRLLAITARAAELSAPGGDGWRSLVTLRLLAAYQAGRARGLTRPVRCGGDRDRCCAAGRRSCTRPGVTGIFARTADGWRQAGCPVLPATLARQRVAVLRLTGTASGAVALLAAGTGRNVVLIPAWSTGGGTAWTAGEPFPLNGLLVQSVSAGAGGSWGVVLAGGHCLIFSAPGGRPARYAPPPLPRSAAVAGTSATLVAGPGRQLTALVPGGRSVAIWQLVKGKTWDQVQLLEIPLPPGASADQ